MNDRILSMIGLARRAGKVGMGADAVKGSLLEGKSRLVLVASDASAKTLKEARFFCENARRECLLLRRTMDQIGAAVGRRVGMISIEDDGFAKRIRELCRADCEGGINE